MPIGLPVAAVGAPIFLPIERQHAIEEALSSALIYIRSAEPTQQRLALALARTNRAMTLLKRAREVANAAGRA